jgi:hypothetical protein
MDEPLACQRIVFRALTRSGWVAPNGQILSGAFIRRPVDHDGLSVDIASAASCAAPFRKCYGVASLHVGRVRRIGLDIVVDIVVDMAPHANITGVPRPEDDAANAERLAGLLAKQSRLVPPEAGRPSAS